MGRKSIKAKGEATFSLTSMLDMFTILLLFLIKQTDTEGNLLTQAENLKLPISTSLKSQAEVALVVVVDSKAILVDNEKVAETPDVAKQDSLLVAGMIPVLEKKREEEKKAALAHGNEPDAAGRVVVQLDKNSSYDVMYKVMASCGWAGYTNVSFAVVMKNAES